MLVINKSQVILSEGSLVAEASSIGLAPGEWPQFISVVNDANEGYIFQRQHMIDVSPDRRDFGGYAYAGKRGEVLIVHND